MEGWVFQDFLNFAGSLLVAVGGASAVILGLSKWFGGVLADKLLEKDKAKYQQNLEDLKARYQAELEKTKNDLEKSKALFLRYSEHQFKLYNELWQSLIDLKFAAEDLWEKLDVNKLKSFSKQIRATKKVVEQNILLIEEEHYERLSDVLVDFEEFEFGKAKLGELRNRSAQEFQEANIDHNQIRMTIQRNGEIKDEFTELLDELAITFRNQLKGNNGENGK